MKKLIIILVILSTLCSLAYAGDVTAPIRYLDFEDGCSGGTCTDTGTDEIDAIDSNTGNVTGKLGSGRDYNAATDFINTTLTGMCSGNFSTSFWVKYDTDDYMHPFWIGDSAEAFAVGLQMRKPANPHYWKLTVDATLVVYTNNPTWILDTWYHVVIIKNGTNTWGMYLNGAPMPIASTATPSCGSYSLIFGKPSSQSTRGIFDETGIYDFDLNYDQVQQLYNSGSGWNPIPSSSSIHVVNDSYDNHAINFTTDGGQSCGYNTSEAYILCGPTEGETPTIRFNTIGNADCKLWNETKNWTTLENEGIVNCSTTGSNNHVCTFPENLPDATYTLYISCKSGDDEINDFSSYPANKFNITIDKVYRSNDAMQEGIESSAVWPATVYNTQQVYIRALNGTQMLGTFDKVASSGNQRWAFNYISIGQSFINMLNLTPVFYALEMEGMTNATIRSTVSAFINNTKS